MLDYALRISAEEELGLTSEKSRSCRYPTLKITDIDYIDDQAIVGDNLQNIDYVDHIEQAAQEIG